jgi:hypothetical protein
MATYHLFSLFYGHYFQRPKERFSIGVLRIMCTRILSIVLFIVSVLGHILRIFNISCIMIVVVDKLCLRVKRQGFSGGG